LTTTFSYRPVCSSCDVSYYWHQPFPTPVLSWWWSAGRMGCRPCGPRFLLPWISLLSPPSLRLVGQDGSFFDHRCEGSAINSDGREARLHDQCSRAGISEMGSWGGLAVKYRDGRGAGHRADVASRSFGDPCTRRIAKTGRTSPISSGHVSLGERPRSRPFSNPTARDHYALRADVEWPPMVKHRKCSPRMPVVCHRFNLRRRWSTRC